MKVSHFHRVPVLEEDQKKKAQLLLNNARLHVVCGECSGVAYLDDPLEYATWLATIETLRTLVKDAN